MGQKMGKQPLVSPDPQFVPKYIIKHKLDKKKKENRDVIEVEMLIAGACDVCLTGYVGFRKLCHRWGLGGAFFQGWGMGWMVYVVGHSCKREPMETGKGRVGGMWGFSVDWEVC